MASLIDDLTETRLTSEQDLPTPDDSGGQTKPTQRPWLVIMLLAVASLLFLWQLGALPLFDVDEPRYAQTAREMIQRHDWITPYFNGQVRFDKPVLYYWLIAASYQLFGVSEWSARLVSVGATLATAGGLWWGTRYLSASLAPVFSLLFLCTLMVTGIGRMSITDMTLTLWMTLTTLIAYRATQPQQSRWWLLAGITAGLGILTKGPVALALPGLVVLLTSVLQKRVKAAFASPWPWVGAGLGIAIALPWFWACYQANGQSFIDALLLHNVTRFEGVVSGHRQPWFFYAVVLVAGVFPWTAFLPGSVAAIWQNRRSALPLDRLGQFALVWLLTVFGFFQVAQTKLLTYLLPLFPAVAILLGYYWQRGRQSHLLLATRISLAVTAVVFTAMGVIGLDRFLPKEAAGIGVQEGIWAVGFALLAGQLAAERLLARNARLWALASLCGGWLLSVGLVITTILPVVNQLAHAPVWHVREYVAQQGDLPVITYQMQRPSLTYYLNKPIPSINRLAALQAMVTPMLNNHQPLLILTKQSFRAEVQSTFPACHVIRQSKVYALLRCN